MTFIRETIINTLFIVSNKTLKYQDLLPLSFNHCVFLFGTHIKGKWKSIKQKVRKDYNDNMKNGLYKITWILLWLWILINYRMLEMASSIDQRSRCWNKDNIVNSPITKKARIQFNRKEIIVIGDGSILTLLYRDIKSSW